MRTAASSIVDVVVVPKCVHILSAIRGIWYEIRSFRGKRFTFRFYFEYKKNINFDSLESSEAI